MLKELVEYVVVRLVDAPDRVEITENTQGNTVTVRVCVAAEDLGKVIGKEGRTARSLRTLVYAAATKSGKRAVLEITK